ncbi:tyrosine recombinase XerC [Rubritalea spongiae]|uniref:Tyrosine recombinase XerC n=1 Tax=Rubritalea spongiae TaxID=430797 RepID=A0ABW5DZQ9_9BACT
MAAKKETGVKGLDFHGASYRYRRMWEGKQRSVRLKTDDLKKAKNRINKLNGFLETYDWDEAVAKTLGERIKKRGTKTTIEEFIRLYEEFNLPSKNPSPVKQSTAESYFHRLKQVASYAEIEHIEDFEGKSFYDICKVGEAANATLNNRMRAVRSLFRDDVLKFLAGKGIQMTTPFADDKLLKEEIKPYKPFSIEKQKEIGKGCEKLPSSQAMIVKMALGIGLRRAEIEHAQVSWLRNVDEEYWCDVSPVGGWTPKNGKGRSIPIPPELAKKLFELREASSDYTPDTQWLIPCERGGNTQSRLFSDMTSVIKWLEEQGVGKDSHDNKLIHMLRKQFGSEVLRVEGIHVASKYLGHKSIITTERHYVDLIDKPVVDVFGDSEN